VAQPLGEYVFLRPRWPNSACLQQANQAMRSLGMPGDDLALDPGALVALARLTPWGDFCVRMVRTVCRPRFQRDSANRYRQHTDLGGGRLAILPNRLSRDRPQPQIP
jgi:hypothetical protein